MSKNTLARPSEILSLRLKDFIFTSDPPYLTIPEYAAKNDIQREAFFTNETKDFLLSHLKKRKITAPNQFVFLNNNMLLDPFEEEKNFQQAVDKAYHAILAAWIRVTGETRRRIEQRGIDTRYSIHIYSFKKYGFTKIADILGELAAHAIAGHKAYLITYYKKNRDERAEDFKRVAPKLELFRNIDEQAEKLKKQITASLEGQPEQKLTEIIETLKTLKIVKRICKRLHLQEKPKN